MHALTGACLAAGADIVSLDVIERGGGSAIDDLCITRVDDVDALRLAIDHLPGCSSIGGSMVPDRPRFRRAL